MDKKNLKLSMQTTKYQSRGIYKRLGKESRGQENMYEKNQKLSVRTIASGVFPSGGENRSKSLGKYG